MKKQETVKADMKREVKSDIQLQDVLSLKDCHKDDFFILSPPELN